MTLLRNGIDLSLGLTDFISNSENIFIYVPYIKLESLKLLLKSTSECKIIVVRWELRDLILGSSDLEVYQYCKERSITLYRNSRLHLKAFIDNYKRCVMGSANISSRALNLPEMQGYNYELATTIKELTIEDRLYFNSILNESILITDSIYNQIIIQLDEKKNEFPDETDFEFTYEYSEKNFLISALPMTYDIYTLLKFYQRQKANNETELNCAIHDLILYGLPLGLTQDSIIAKLKVAFFNHPFIKAFLANLDMKGEIYFGTAKDWIHKNCTDVPTPRKWEITENIQILFRWIVELSDGKYKVDVPGKFSQRLSFS